MTKIDEIVRMEDLAANYSTKADKIRILARHGYKTADIARVLDIRYQHVRNTLEGDKRTGYNPDLVPNYSGVEADTPDSQPSFRVLEIGEDGFANIPPDLIEDLVDGDLPLYALQLADGLFVCNVKGMEARVRASFA